MMERYGGTQYYQHPISFTSIYFMLGNILLIQNGNVPIHYFQWTISTIYTMTTNFLFHVVEHLPQGASTTLPHFEVVANYERVHVT